MKTKQNNPTRIYREVSVKDRLPMYTEKNIITNRGVRDFSHGHFWHKPPHHLKYDELVSFWLEEIDLPTEEAIRQFANELSQDDVYTTEQEIESYVDGASFILNHIKGGG